MTWAYNNKEKQKQVCQHERKQQLFVQLEQAIQSINGFQIAVIASLLMRLPDIQEARSLRSAGKQTLEAYRIFHSYLDRLLSTLHQVPSKIISPSEIEALHSCFLVFRSYTKTDFVPALKSLSRAASGQESMFVQRVQQAINRKGGNDLRLLVSKLQSIQTLMEQLLSSPQYLQASVIAQEKHNYLKSRVSLKQAEVAEHQAQSAAFREQQRLIQIQKERSEALAHKRADIERAQAAREKAEFERRAIEKLEDLPTIVFISAFSTHLIHQIEGNHAFHQEHRQQLKQLFETLEHTLYDVGEVPIISRYKVPEYADRADKLEAMFAIWDQKENKLEHDVSLSDEQIQRRKDHYDDIRDRDLDSLYEQEDQPTTDSDVPKELEEIL